MESTPSTKDYYYYNYDYNGSYPYYYDMVDVVTHTYLLPIITGFGILGNAMCLLVMCLQRLRNPSKDHLIIHCLRALAVSDLLFCVFTLLSSWLPYDSVYETHNIFYYYGKAASFIISTFVFASTWITVAMATIRFLAICYPLKMIIRDRLTVKVTYVILISIFICSVLASFPLLLLTETQSEEITSTVIPLEHGNTTKLRIKWDTQSTLFTFMLYLHMFVGNLIPSAALLVLNTLLIRKVRESSMMQAQMRTVQRANSDDSHTSKRDNKLNATLIATVTVFLVLVGPVELLRLTVKKFFPTGFSEYENISNMMQALNFSVNFILYYVVNSTFRQHLNQLIMCRRRGRKSSLYRRTRQTDM